MALTDLTHRAYRWHNRQITEDRGFDPRKARSRDTFYVGIDLRAVNFMIRKYRQSGFFDEEFFANYRALALRMDKELRNKQAVWREGDLPPFNHDADPWCNCSDPPGVYWQEVKITSLAIDGNRAEIVWTSGKGFYYHLRAAKKAGIWKLSYLEGYDSKRYHWASAE